MRQNVDINHLGESAEGGGDAHDGELSRGKADNPCKAKTSKVRINEGDAWCVLPVLSHMEVTRSWWCLHAAHSCIIIEKNENAWML
jgi:hypothetical protein